MSKSEEKKESRIKTKKKTWYKILAPKILGYQELGESYLTSLESALGRVVKINLKEVTGNIRDQNAYLSFQIVKVEGTTLKTVITGYEIMPGSIKRMIRKGSDRVDYCFTAVSKDNGKVVVKTLLIPIHKIQRSVQTQLRKKLEELMREEIKQNTFEQVVSNLVGSRTKTLLKSHLTKIYPLREIAIRALELHTKTLGVEEVPVSEEPELLAESLAEPVPAVPV